MCVIYSIESVRDVLLRCKFEDFLYASDSTSASLQELSRYNLGIKEGRETEMF